MVSPVTDEERQASLRVLAIGFVGLVGVSAALMAYWGGAPLREIVVVGLVGGIVGVGLMAFLGSDYGP